jgi:pilus assembly protein CpaC
MNTPIGHEKGWQMVINAMKRWCAGGAILLLSSLGPVPVLADTQVPPPVQVEVGAQRVIKLDKPAQRVAVGNGEIVQIKLLGKQEVLVQGIKPGVTSLLTWSKGSGAPTSQRIQVNQALADAAMADFPGLRLKASSNLILLEGNSPNLERHAAARQIAQHASGDGKAPVQDNARLPYSSEVQIDVRVVELSRRVLKKAGLNLISNTSGFTFGTFAPSSLSEVRLDGRAISTEATLPVSQALNLVMGAGSEAVVGVLSMLEGNGFIRTLAQPSLVAQSGQSASFLAGGEFPVPVPQGNGQITIQYKPYGIRLDVSPTVLAENRIALRIAPEVSDLDFENAVTLESATVPSLITRRADTSVELGNGESFVIGGLVSQSVVKNIDKIPGLGDIPVLGLFFKSARLTRDDKELLIIVTPRLVRPIAANVQIGPLPGAELADYNPSLWGMLLSSDNEETGRFTGLSR